MQGPPGSAPTYPEEKSIRRPLMIWAAVTSAVLVIHLAVRWWSGSWSLGSRLLDGFSQFDGPEYLQIAAEGYQQRQLVWFPLYPLMIRALDSITSDGIISAVLLTLTASAVAAAMYGLWLARQGVTGAARTPALLMLLLYPYAFFLYGAVYADALFLALCLAAFVSFEGGRTWLAVAAAALATATRPSGFAVVAGLLVLTLERRGVLSVAADPASWAGRLRVPTRVRRERFSASALWPLAGLSGLVAYGGYQWSAFGSPLRFMSEQSNYHEPGTASALKQQYFSAFYEGFDTRFLATTTLQAIILAVVVAMVPAVGRRFGWGYAVYTFGLALMPAVSVSTFMGIGRYLLPAFPAFALAGEWLARRPRLAVGWLLVSGSVMFLMAFGFARSWYLS